MILKLTNAICLFVLITVTSPLAGQSVNWENDLDTAKQKAAAEGKLILLHFQADWCRPCVQLDTFVFRNESVQRKLNNDVVAVKVDVDVHPDLVSEYTVKSIPFDVVITPNGNEVHRQKSASSSDNYLSMLKRVSGMGKQIASADPGTLKSSQDFQSRFQAERAKMGPRADAPSMAFDSTNVNFRPPTKELDPVSGSSNDFQATSFANNTNNMERPATSATATPRFGTANSGSFVSNQHVQTATTDSQNLKPRSENNNAFVTSPQSNGGNNRFVAPSSNQFQAGNQTPESNSFAARQPAASAPSAPLRVKNTTSQSVQSAKTQKPFALGGNCPVSLLTISKWVPGDKQFGCVHRGKTYLFASQQHLDTFLSDPDLYSPVLAGFDPVSFVDQGQLNDGLEALGVFMSKGGHQKVVLFETAENRDKFQKDPKKYLQAVRVATETVDQGTTIRR